MVRSAWGLAVGLIVAAPLLGCGVGGDGWSGDDGPTAEPGGGGSGGGSGGGGGGGGGSAGGTFRLTADNVYPVLDAVQEGLNWAGFHLWLYGHNWSGFFCLTGTVTTPGLGQINGTVSFTNCRTRNGDTVSGSYTVSNTKATGPITSPTGWEYDVTFNSLRIEEGTAQEKEVTTLKGSARYRADGVISLGSRGVKTISVPASLTFTRELVEEGASPWTAVRELKAMTATDDPAQGPVLLDRWTKVDGRMRLSDSDYPALTGELVLATKGSGKLEVAVGTSKAVLTAGTSGLTRLEVDGNGDGAFGAAAPDLVADNPDIEVEAGKWYERHK